MNRLLTAILAGAIAGSWAPSLFALTISEIMYNPGPDGVEYIEIYNEDAEARDLSNYYFSRGVTFQFSGYKDDGSVFIRGKSFLVISPDPERMLQLHPHLETVDPLFPALIGPVKEAMASFGSLDNAGEGLALANPGGAVDAEVEYNNRGGWPSAADGTGHSLVLRNPDLDDPADNDNWTWSPLVGGSPGLANFGETVYDDTVLVGPAESWKVFRGRAEASDPREAWRQAAFDPAAWEDGSTPLGMKNTAGRNDACYTGTLIDDMQGSYLSVFLRRTFEVADPSGFDLLVLKISFDDGFIAYLNGKEVARRNMNNGDAFDARASSSSECTTRTEIEIPDAGNVLVQGPNVLAIQVHNQVITGDDMGVIPELLGRKGRNVGGAPKVDVDLNELMWNVAAGGQPWLEIHNDQDVEQDISGWFLSDDPVRLDLYTFPTPTLLPPRGFVVVHQAALEASGIVLDRLDAPTDRTKFLALSRALAGQPPERRLQVVDAYRFRLNASPATVGMSDGRYPDGDEDWVVCRAPSAGTANAYQVNRQVVINEIMYHPFHPFQSDHEPGTGGFRKPEDQGEYLELHNKGPEAVDIGGWAFSRGVEFAFPAGTSIPAGGYLVVARDPVYIRSHYALPAAQVLGPWYNARFDPEGNEFTDTAVLADGGERVELVDEIGNPVDAVRYHDNARWSPWADSRGSSLERIDPFQPGNRAGNWDASDESAKSQWTRYTFRGRYTESEKELQVMLLTRGIVLIDNLSITDPANVAAGNYIKNGDFEQALALDPNGARAGTWMLDGTHIHSGRTTTDKKDGEASLKLIATGRGNNRLDRIRYAGPLFPVNRELLLEFDAKWICGEATLLFCGTWNTFAHRFHLEVPAKAGTPGKENSVRLRLLEGNNGPLVERVQQEPVLPAAAQDVVVRAEVTDPDGMREVKLKYSLDSARLVPTELAMLDDGQGPDRKAGDGVYAATIPGQAQGKRVLFSIEAVDAGGNGGRFPFDDRRRTHPYLLDLDTQDASKLRYAIYIHGLVQKNTGGLPEYRILMHNETFSYLTSRHTMNNDVVDCSFVWNDSKILYNVGVRYGNSPWTRPGGRSYVMKLPREEMLQGYKKFKLDNRGSEINERAVYYLIRSNNVPGRDPVPYGRSTYARPVINATPEGAVFERVEMPGKAFVERWWPNDADGALYKLDDKFLVNLPAGNHRANRDAFIRFPPDGSGVGTDEEEYRWYFLPRTRDKYDDFSELIDLARFFTPTQTPQSAYESQLFERVNVESLIRTLAVEINVDDWDTWGTTRGKNSFIYRPRVDGRWTLIGWDKDLTLGNPGGLPLVPGNFPEAARLLNSVPGKRIYNSILSDMLSGFYQADYVNLFFNQHARDRTGKSIPGIPGSAAGAASFLTSRAATIRSAIPRSPVFDLVTGGAEGVVNAAQPSLTVEGNAPFSLWLIVVRNPGDPHWLDPQGRIQELVLDVNAGDLSWTSTGTRWKTGSPIPVPDGLTELVFEGYGSDLALLGTDTLRILRNVNWEAPTVTAVDPPLGPPTGAVEVTVRGTGFQTGAKVTFGAAIAPVLLFDATAGTIQVRVPAGAPGPVDVKVQNLDGKSGVLPGGFTYSGARFNRGDADINAAINLTDVIVILNYMFSAGALTCLDAADVNDDAEINLTDPIVLLNYQFLAGEPPAAPFDPLGVQVGEDPTPADPLGCQQGR